MKITYGDKYWILVRIGDCQKLIEKISDNSIDLIMTSPPYADLRNYDGFGEIKPDNYVDWFLPKSKEFLRVLKETGSFVLNIKDKVVDGERHPFVFELVLALRKQGWKWIETYIWKKPAMPGTYGRRCKDGFEYCFWFSKTKKPKFILENIQYRSKWRGTRKYTVMNKCGREIDYGRIGSRKFSFPDNVIITKTNYAREDSHIAVFPGELPRFFIKLATTVGDVVLDPFAGSGTTGMECRKLSRNCILFDINPKYKPSMLRKLKSTDRSIDSLEWDVGVSVRNFFR